MEVSDTTVVNVSCSTCPARLSVRRKKQPGFLTSYLVANAIVLPSTRWLGTYVALRNILLVSFGGFTGFSFLFGIAPNLPSHHLPRAPGATGGGLHRSLKPPDGTFPAETAKAHAVWARGIVVAPMLGPEGARRLDHRSYSALLFYINIPLGIAAVSRAVLFIHDSLHQASVLRLDTGASATIVAGQRRAALRSLLSHL